MPCPFADILRNKLEQLQVKHNFCRAAPIGKTDISLPRFAIAIPYRALRLIA
jgi:hypothetical protein